MGAQERELQVRELLWNSVPKVVDVLQAPTFVPTNPLAHLEQRLQAIRATRSSIPQQIQSKVPTRPTRDALEQRFTALCASLSQAQSSCVSEKLGYLQEIHAQQVALRQQIQTATA